MTDDTVAKREKMSKENVRECGSDAFKGCHWWELCPTFSSSLEMMAILGQRNNVGIPIILLRIISVARVLLKYEIWSSSTALSLGALFLLKISFSFWLKFQGLMKGEVQVRLC